MDRVCIDCSDILGSASEEEDEDCIRAALEETMQPLSPFATRKREHAELSLSPCRKVSVVVHVQSSSSETKHCLFPLEDVRDIVAVNPQAFGKYISGAVTMETAKIVAQIAKIPSEDWTRSYRFSHVVWRKEDEPLRMAVQAAVNDVCGAVAVRTFLSIGSLRKTKILFGAVTSQSIAAVMGSGEPQTDEDIIKHTGLLGYCVHQLLLAERVCTVSVLEVADEHDLFDLLSNQKSLQRVSLRYPSSGGGNVDDLTHAPIDSLKSLGTCIRRAFAAAQSSRRKAARGTLVATLRVWKEDASFSTIQFVDVGLIQNDHMPAFFRRNAALRKSEWALGGVLRGILLREAGNESVIPYRESALTKVLQRSIEESDSRTVVLAAVSSSTSQYEESMATLRYVSRLTQRLGQTPQSPFVSGKSDTSPSSAVAEQWDDADFIRHMVTDPRQRLAKIKPSPKPVVEEPPVLGDENYNPTHYEAREPQSPQAISSPLLNPRVDDNLQGPEPIVEEMHPNGATEANESPYEPTEYMVVDPGAPSPEKDKQEGRGEYLNDSLATESHRKSLSFSSGVHTSVEEQTQSTVMNPTHQLPNTEVDEGEINASVNEVADVSKDDVDDDEFDASKRLEIAIPPPTIAISSTLPTPLTNNMSSLQQTISSFSSPSKSAQNGFTVNFAVEGGEPSPLTAVTFDYAKRWEDKTPMERNTFETPTEESFFTPPSEWPTDERRRRALGDDVTGKQRRDVEPLLGSLPSPTQTQLDNLSHELFGNHNSVEEGEDEVEITFGSTSKTSQSGKSPTLSAPFSMRNVPSEDDTIQSSTETNPQISQVEQLRESQDKLKDDLWSLEGERNGLKSDMEAQETKYRTLLEEKETEVRLLSEKLQKSHDENAEVVKIAEEAITTQGHLERKLAKMQHEASLQNDVVPIAKFDSLQRDYDSLEQENTNLLKDLSKFKSQLHESDVSVSDLRLQQTKSDLERARMREENSKYQQELELLRLQMNTSSLTDTLETDTEMRRLRDELSRSVTRSEKREAELLSEISIKEETIGGLENEIKNLSRQVSSFAKGSPNRFHGKEVIQLREDLEKLGSRSRDVLRELERTRIELNARLKDIEVLSASLKKVLKEKEDAEALVKSMDERLKQFETETQQLIKSIQRGREEETAMLDSTISENRELSGEVRDLRERNDLLRERVRLLEMSHEHDIGADRYEYQRPARTVYRYGGSPSRTYLDDEEPSLRSREEFYRNSRPRRHAPSLSTPARGSSLAGESHRLSPGQSMYSNAELDVRPEDVAAYMALTAKNTVEQSLAEKRQSNAEIDRLNREIQSLGDEKEAEISTLRRQNRLLEKQLNESASRTDGSSYSYQRRK